MQTCVSGVVGGRYAMCQRVYRFSDVDQSFVTCLVLLPPCLPKILPATEQEQLHVCCMYRYTYVSTYIT